MKGYQARLRALLVAMWACMAAVLWTVVWAAPRAPVPPALSESPEERWAPVAVPNMLLRDIPLPAMLTRHDSVLYNRIFDLQEEGMWYAADRLIAQLGDPMLMGHVLFQRYMHPTAYRSHYQELRDWLALYADHPGGKRLRSLALRRKPPGVRLPRVRQAEIPAALQHNGLGPGAEDSRPVAIKASRLRKIRSVQRRYRSQIQRGLVTLTLQNLNSPYHRRLFDPLARVEMLGIIARGYFRYGKDAQAVEVALMALEEATAEGLWAWEAGWWGGLSAWRSQEWEAAGALFSHTAQSTWTPSSTRAAAGFWAGRVALSRGILTKAQEHFQSAARHATSFYGLLAQTLSGQSLPMAPGEVSKVTAEDASILLSIPAVRRAMALVESGQSARAEAELVQLRRRLNNTEVARLVKLTGALRLARSTLALSREQEVRGQSAALEHLFPVPLWAHGQEDLFLLDRALVVGFVRRESAFNPSAVSHAGARGLMQLMPATARFIARKVDPRRSRVQRHQLLESDYSLTLGQHYLRHLMEHYEGDYLLTVAAYNAGSGNLRKWERFMVHNDDPLLFIETIPSLENRLFVKGVLRNVWIYRRLLGQEAPTLQALAEGHWPRYSALESGLILETMVHRAP